MTDVVNISSMFQLVKLSASISFLCGITLVLCGDSGLNCGRDLFQVFYFIYQNNLCAGFLGLIGCPAVVSASTHARNFGNAIWASLSVT